MATIIVEDGSKVSNANSYVSEAELTTYATDRGVTLSSSTDELLIKAMDYLDSLEFQGIKSSKDQALQWPRVNVVIDTYYVDGDEIPVELKNAQLAIATAIDQGNGPLRVISRQTKREKVDVLEIEYADGSASQTIDPTISLNLRKLLAGGTFSGISFKVDRA